MIKKFNEIKDSSKELEKLSIIEQYLEDVFSELEDYNFIFTVLSNPPDQSNFYKGEIRIIVGKEGWREFTYSEIENIMKHAISYLSENGYEMEKKIPYHPINLIRGIEIKFINKQKIESFVEHYKYSLMENLQSDLEDIFAGLYELKLRTISQIQDKYIMVYITAMVSHNITYHITDVKDDVNHFISQMNEYNHKLYTVKYRSLNPRKWHTLYDVNESPSIKNFLITDEFNGEIDSIELKFIK
jgi:hypothetical protein